MVALLTEQISKTTGEARALPRWLLTPGAIFFAVSLAMYAGVTRVLPWSGYDLSVYLMGGSAWRAGQPVYDAAMVGEFGLGYYTYPPVTVLLFGPLSLLPVGVVHALLWTLSFAALVGVIWLALRLLGYAQSKGLIGLTLGLTAVALWLQPVFDTFDEAQVNLFIVVAVLADFFLDGRRRWPTGVLIGATVALKITPGIFIVYLLISRRFRAAATATATFAGLTLLGFIVAGRDSVQYWFEGTFADSVRVAMPLTTESVYNQSIYGTSTRIAGDTAGTVIWVVLALAVAVVGLSVAVVAARVAGPLAGILATALTGLLIAPLSWNEHWVWMVAVLPFLVHVAWQFHDRRPVLAGALPFVAVVPYLMWPQPLEEGRLGPAAILSTARHLWEDDGNHSVVVALLGTAYVAPALLLLLGGGYVLYRHLGQGVDPFLRALYLPVPSRPARTSA